MKTEKVITIAFLIGLLFKYMQWAGGGIIVVLSLFSLAILYFPAAFYFFGVKSGKNQNTALSVVSGFFLSIIPIGILFKIQYWPNAEFFLLVGTVAGTILFFFIFFLKSKAPDNLKIYYKNMVLRTAILSVLALFLYLIPTETLIKIQFRNDPEMARLKTLHYTYPENEEFRRQHDAYILTRDSLNLREENERL